MFSLELSHIWSECLMPFISTLDFSRWGRLTTIPLLTEHKYSAKCSSLLILLKRSYSLAFKGKTGMLKMFSCRWGSIFKGSNSACFADKVLQEIMVHFCKAWSLCYYSQMVYTKPKAEFFQILETTKKYFNKFVFSNVMQRRMKTHNQGKRIW